jgi:hypothetical protein
VRRQAGCAVSAVAVLAATVLPWSSTAAAGRNGWETASLALALDEAVHRPLLTLFACVWFVVPLVAAVALVLSSLLPRRSAAVTLRIVGALLGTVVLAVLVGLHQAGWEISLLGPLLALAGGAALVALPGRSRTQPRRRRNGAAATGVLP